MVVHDVLQFFGESFGAAGIDRESNDVFNARLKNDAGRGSPTKSRAGYWCIWRILSGPRIEGDVDDIGCTTDCASAA